ncbi:MAG: hypothetical protein KQH63_02715 [Desulfobulbaceae bacterium]|nr:hypothetical protein [Desulfobulbaceae bacterium]
MPQQKNIYFINKNKILKPEGTSREREPQKQTALLCCAMQLSEEKLQGFFILKT